MAKIDVRKDYYGDLGLGPSANTDEIKKQFRKLALKYHPDRNPGKEAEYITKFQAIQAAHEILTDSQQRLKYDTERLRAGYGRLYDPPAQTSSRRANTSSSTAYASAAAAAKSSTPKPPRPTSYQNPPSGSAQRFASYAKAAPQQTYEYEQKQARADAYRGFQTMPGWAKFNPTNGKTGPPPPPTRSNTTAGTSGQSSRRSAYDHVNNRPHPAAFGRSATTKKKQGFAPGTPGGDEPMARNVSAYANTPRAERTSAFFDSVPSPTARRTPASSRPETPLEDPAPEFERTSHPYARTGGERTYFNSAGLARAYSMRDSSSSRARSRTNPPSPTSPVSSRHRSASPKYRHSSSSSSSLSSEEESDSDTDIPTFVPRQKATPTSRLRPSQRFHFQGSGSGEDIPGHSTVPQIRSTRRFRGHLGGDRRHSDHEFHGHSTDSDHYQGHDSDSAAFVFKAQQHANSIDPTRQGNTGVHGLNEKYQNAEYDTNSGAKSRSHDNLNQRFSASDWGDAFRPDLFVPNRANGHQRSRSRTSPMRGRPSRRTNVETQSNVTSSSDEAARQQQSTARTKSQFSAEAWAEHLQNTNWATPKLNSEAGPSHPQPQSKANTVKSGRKISRPASRMTRPQQPAVSTEAEENKATVPDPAQKASTPIPDAMDIDEESSQPANAQASTVKRSQPKSKGGVPIGNSSKSEQAGNSLNLDPLHNVAPFTDTNSGGIDDLKDMFTTLPFESRAHDPNVKRSMAQNRKFDLPSPPTRPPKPAIVSLNGDPRNMVLPRQSWELYVRQINAYITEWNDFQRQMLQILTVRQVAFETGLAPRWVDAIGDSIQLNVASEPGSDSGWGDTDGSETGNPAELLIPEHPHGGYKAYVNALEEHARIRAHLDIACERHQECIMQLGEIRKWIRTRGKIV
ncbi:Meiotically up-regulated gene 184 protein [Talaromyces islandicus]|uniref:Meiotically up-regulated gene 184 protein n=1 Tax=Talaromyces islandicus TaxID=28573 RepID=A0A0U1M102_TALIS|nr:Meiotically up-regulated gene 184 protein [Talaromyces islandicus]